MSSIPIGRLIGTIASISSPIIKNKAERSQTVIKLLKQFNLEPDHPPNDFTGVYAYALVEYGVGKPKQFLQLFEQETIKKSFRKAFDHCNSSILLSEVDHYVEGYALGDEVKSLGINIKREIAAFLVIFINVVKCSRTPADVLTNHKIDSLHQTMISLHEKLERLPNIEAIRTEIARLTLAENVDKLTPSIQTNKFQTIALAQEMRSWFETLGYRFEKDEIWRENFFEWIINIPVRRNRYDRVLVRGIEGEVGLRDVMCLRQSVEERQTDEGWLVTTRRIAPAALHEVEKEENDFLSCYTFDEILAQDADFSGYLDWLEREIERRKIDTKYVPLACTKEEIDINTQKKIAVSSYGEKDGWIDGYIDRWLDDPVKEHISILGEFGTGKTWFALHYAWVTIQRYRDCQKRGVTLPRLPLVIPLRDYAKAVSVESLFSEFFFRKYKIPLPHYDAFEQLNRMGKLLLIFDGFDEMATRISRQDMINNFWELAKVVVPGTKVILTCRTEHFPEAKEGRALLSGELQASTTALIAEAPQFEVLELEKFTEEQIQQVLSSEAEPETVDKVMSNPQLLELASRPVMSDLILEALPDIEAERPIDISRVYLYAVKQKMQRDIKAERTFTSLSDKLYFLCELSWEMLSTDAMSLNYRLFPERIRRLFGSIVQEEKDLDHWHYDMMGQTMLIRNAQGDYSPAHRSLLEFFVAYKFAAELGILAPDFIELAQAKSNLGVNTTPQNYSWSSYFLPESKRNNANLQEFVAEDICLLAETFGKQKLTPAIIVLMEDMLISDQEELKIRLLKIIENTRGKSAKEVGFVGGNIITLLSFINPDSLKDNDFSDTNLTGLDLSLLDNYDLRIYREIELDLSNTRFERANLEDSNFGDVKIANSNFQYTNLSGVEFQIRQFDGAFSLHPHKPQLAIVSFDDIILWDLKLQSIITRIETKITWNGDIKHSPDGKFLFSSGYNNFEIRDSQTLEKISTIQISDVELNLNGLTSDFTFTSNSKLLFLLCQNSDIYVYDVLLNKEIKVLTKHQDTITSIAIIPDKNLLASSSSSELIVWDIDSLKVKSNRAWNRFNSKNILFHPSGKLVAVQYYFFNRTNKEKDRILFLNPNDLSIIDELAVDGVRKIAINDEGSLICAASHTSFVLIDFITKQIIYDSKYSDCVNLYHPNMIVSGVKEVFFDVPTQNVFILLRSGHVIIFDIIKFKVVDVIHHFQNVLKADFRNATGIKPEIAKCLEKHGAII
ncbi:NACHT domain-containing protein [Crocosphaera sp.]|uniref:NACHT domain-containing protein n=1 Tax=Crocosphaera sp. TaxID=2729996 RepID=UPI0026095CDB|nr:NACHT domain-containing protein [Crocosphaera sp.]MDJ0581190.1 NACHT domain-containing protein [Crocosphaera sp.]